MAHSKEYVNELKKLHSKKTFGTSGSIPNDVKDLLESESITSVLDYGAGKGNTSKAFRDHYPNLNVFSYDPATFPIELPKTVDLIYSSDVLEHIEPELINETLIDLSKRATLYQYHLIACHPAKKSLSDGRNAHLIIENPDWWKNKIQSIPNWLIIKEEIREFVAKVKKGPPIPVTKYIVIMKRI